MIVTTTALLLSFAPSVPQERDPEWLLVRSRAERYGPTDWDHIGGGYLRDLEYRLVTPEEAGALPATSRFVVGTPTDNELVRQLAPELGIVITDHYLYYGSLFAGATVGMTLVTDDPDGSGTLVLVTGIDDSAVSACFSVDFNREKRGYMLACRDYVIERGSLDLEVYRSRPSVVRLDREQSFLFDRARAQSGGEQALRLARGLRGYQTVLAKLGYENLFVDAHRMLHDTAIDRARARFAELDLDEWVRSVYEECVEFVGVRPDPAPVFYFAYGPQEGTSAVAFDPDPQTRRRQVAFNLCAMRDAEHLRESMIHEIVHTMQKGVQRRLMDRALNEGSAVFLTQALEPGYSDARVLGWSESELAAARQRHGEILRAFLRSFESPDRRQWRAFVHGAEPLEAVPGAPSRTAYYLGFLACRAWRSAHPREPLSELLRADPEEIFALLE